MPLCVSHIPRAPGNAIVLLMRTDAATSLCHSYQIAPVSFVALLVPFAVLEAQTVLASTAQPPAGPLLASAAAAFGLNCAVFLLIGNTSALTMNIAGVFKDLLLIASSVALFRCGPGTAWALQMATRARMGCGPLRQQRVQCNDDRTCFLLTNCLRTHSLRSSIVTPLQLVGYGVALVGV